MVYHFKPLSSTWHEFLSRLFAQIFIHLLILLLLTSIIVTHSNVVANHVGHCSCQQMWLVGVQIHTYSHRSWAANCFRYRHSRLPTMECLTTKNKINNHWFYPLFFYISRSLLVKLLKLRDEFCGKRKNKRRKDWGKKMWNKNKRVFIRGGLNQLQYHVTL